MRQPAGRSAVIVFLLVSAFTALSACNHTPPYERPPVAPVAAYKENADWKQAAPKDATIRGDWWELFNNSTLNDLEGQVTVSNETLKAVEAQYNEARAMLRISQSALHPQVTSSPAATANRPSGNRAVSSFHDSFADYLLPATVSYEADLWGRLHETVSASRASAQASAGDLENARLSVHAELAVDYFTLSGLDREEQILNTAVDAYQRALELTQNRFAGGLASQSDVALAETQLETTRAQAVDVQAQRPLVEHAMAVLVGKPASTFSLPLMPLDAEPPVIPAGIPSDLLERRPDIAAAERRVAAANADVGVATAAYYPILTLSGTTGFESSALGNLLTGVSNFWSVGPVALATIFDAGRRHAQVDEARAAYEQTAASYQSSVLDAFREVEDELATLKILEQEAQVQARAVDAAERSLTLANNRYRGGVSSYLEVITAQSAALTNERVAVEILVRRMNASVLLLKAIGGGWSIQSLPDLSANRQ